MALLLLFRITLMPVLLLLLQPVMTHGASYPNNGSPMGINLAGIRYWSTELVFKDLFKHAQPWASQEKGKPYGKGPPLALTPQGWIRWLQPGQSADTLVCRGSGRYPAGRYLLRYQGNGEITIKYDAQLSTSRHGAVSHPPAMDLIDLLSGTGQTNLRDQKKASASEKITEIPFSVVHPSSRGLGLVVTRVDDIDPLHHIEILPEAFREDHYTQPFQPEFISRWARFKVIRFMDWMETNNSKISRWAERPTVGMQTQGSSRGVALSYMITLANTLHADPWFCMPHLADDDYVQQFAQTVADTLNPDLKIYIEYSNETWNYQFEQAAYCRQKGVAMGLGNDPVQAGLLYYTQRALEMFSIWDKVFHPHNKKRLVRVLASQFGNPWTARQLFADPGTTRNVDALAIAPYFGMALSSASPTIELSPGRVVAKNALTLDQILDFLDKEIDANSALLREYAKLTAQWGVDLIAYEGGQHLVGTRGLENDEVLTWLFHQANRNPRMEDLYRKDLNSWKRAGGQLFVSFASMGQYNKWGSWGLLEHPMQDPETAPKYRAVMKYIDKNSNAD
ncbi:hypothetical protein [Desulfobacter vibrioformis]|uniref:hypothetical protein n=1 Tax=Desulfobacter vibrioformis TaxID=34031 RepID=UPI0012EB5E79|nr:hypothetical protein [Desulfobacter vibrioformis]